jgi:formylglycine-generating enzyme
MKYGQVARYMIAMICIPVVSQVLTLNAAAEEALCPKGTAYIAAGIYKNAKGKSASVQALCIDLTETKTSDYKACKDCKPAGTGAYCNAGEQRGDDPINCVTYAQAEAYCAKHSKRLPTQEEWEWVARGGAAANNYPWGKAPPRKQLWWRPAMQLSEEEAPNTFEVGGKDGDITPAGVHDLAGNVAEWTSSGTGAERIVCGGAANSTKSSQVAAGSTASWSSVTESPYIGFRCVASLGQAK